MADEGLRRDLCGPAVALDLLQPDYRHGSGSSSYPTMDLDAIKALDVASITAPDSVLFFWATTGLLMQAGEAMAAWGFKYMRKQAVPWDKGSRSALATGFATRPELLLIGTRGDIPAPAPGKQWPRGLIQGARPRAFAQAGREPTS